MSLDGKRVLITGGAERVGHALALAVARAGADVVIHYGGSQEAAETTRAEIEALGRTVTLVRADLADAEQTTGLIPGLSKLGPLYALINNAAIFEALTWEQTDLEAWNRHLAINLTAPFLLSQAFARSLPAEKAGRIVNLVDWRALRPGPDHLPYTITKSALVALTYSLAAALAPRINVNAMALGAVLPPANAKPPENILENVPAKRWADLDEVCQTLIFLLDGPAYVTGEIIHVDGGRHLV